MADRVGDWVSLLEELFPAADAESWDSVGLQVGEPDAAVEGVLLCLDVTRATLREAVRQGAGLIVAHHPLLFRPLQRLTPVTAGGSLALEAARAGLHVAAAHSNVDVAVEGTTTPIMQLLGVTDAAPLVPTATAADAAKLVVFVPQAHTGDVLAAAFAAGGGRIGEYDECSFRVAGTGTFRPSAQADPAVGERERRNDVAEDRVEILVERSVLPGVVGAVVAAHPYEEVAFDVYPLQPAAPAAIGAAKGLGRVGDLPAPSTVRAIAQRLREGLPSPHLRVAGDPDSIVDRVAACGGAGDSLIAAATAAGAQLYITGDLRHHVTLDALTQGLLLIDAGHHATEAAALPMLHRRLAEAASGRGLRARLIASRLSTDPWIDMLAQEEQQG
ncbi:MAG: Nif3-like dinuclear metal center hexameric protein [Nitriliruptorales bacterium]|nr:Nif3-like dinuclear metal center hexameric protein [Nitriliruptorales bacterium]